jgi:hypothetical protein
VEPKPGIPPSPSHTLELIQEMKRQQVKVIMIEPYFDRRRRIPSRAKQARR